jgi:hypothetical protein
MRTIASAGESTTSLPRTRPAAALPTARPAPIPSIPPHHDAQPSQRRGAGAAGFNVLSRHLQSSHVPVLCLLIVVIITLVFSNSLMPAFPVDQPAHDIQLNAALAACRQWQERGGPGNANRPVPHPVARIAILPVGFGVGGCEDHQWAFQHVRQVLGIELRCTHIGGPDGHRDVGALAHADFFIISHMISPLTLSRFLRRYPKRPRIFVMWEAYVEWWDFFIHSVDGAVGFRPVGELAGPMSPEGQRGVVFRRIPFFIPWHASPGTCSLPEGMLAVNMTADSWASRPRFAALIARHTAYPRAALFHNLSTIGVVDAPSVAFHNMEWDGRDKKSIVRDRRWIITPENRLVGGHVTEKIVDAHISGAVPIWWGIPGPSPDPEPGILNPDRIIILRDGPGVDPGAAMREVVARVDSIERDVPAGTRAAFFAKPAFQPGAAKATKVLCDGYIEVFCAALNRPAARMPSTIPNSAGFLGLIGPLIMKLEDLLDVDLLT